MEKESRMEPLPELAVCIFCGGVVNNDQRVDLLFTRLVVVSKNVMFGNPRIRSWLTGMVCSRIYICSENMKIELEKKTQQHVYHVKTNYCTVCLLLLQSTLTCMC